MYSRRFIVRLRPPGFNCQSFTCDYSEASRRRKSRLRRRQMRTNSPRRRSNDFVSHVTDITLIRYYWSNREEKERERKMCN